MGVETPWEETLDLDWPWELELAETWLGAWTNGATMVEDVPATGVRKKNPDFWLSRANRPEARFFAT